MQTRDIINRYTSAFDATEYKVQLIHADRKQYKPILIYYSLTQLLNSSLFLSHKNTLGYNIYCRPVGYQYVLLDDLTKEVLQELASIKPCLLMETSPNNYQAFLTLSQTPVDREIAVQICKQLAQKFNADLGCAEPDHVGRLPGFRNRKEKYKNALGVSPFVKLHRVEKWIFQ